MTLNVVPAALRTASFAWGGWQAFVIASLLAVMEVSLSFDNAVVNAAVLRRMSPKWQKAFLTWGILIAVFGIRLLFPVLIVAAATGLSMIDVGKMALSEPEVYATHLSAAHIAVASFGGAFLLLVFLGFMVDDQKDVHWIEWVEQKLSRIGGIEAIQIGMTLGVLLILQTFLPDTDRATSLLAGVIGVTTYIVVKGFAGAFGSGEAAVGTAGVGAFIYLKVLDASFSLDGVIGAFAMSNDIVVIMIGLGIGALFVRSMTVALVRKGTLEEFVFLEHGAHWGIGALAVIMLVSTRVHVPELVTGLIGVSLIGLSLLSSMRHKRKN